MSRALPPTQRRAATVRRVDALFQAMSTDFLLREQFVTNPAQVLAEYLYGRQLPPEQASVTNQLVYAVLSDRDMLSWLHDYADERRGAVPSGSEFLSDFSRAVVARGASTVVFALVRAAAADHGLSGLDADVLHYFFNVGTAERTRVDRATATATGTGDATPTGTGTGDAGATVAADGLASAPDERAAGAHEMVESADDVVVAEQGDGDLVATTGTLTAITWTTFITGTGTGTGGTSTGTGITGPITNPFTLTGTNPFPGPFTHTTHTAHHVGENLEVLPRFGPDYMMVTLDAISDYAARLRDIGALEEFG